MVLSEQASRFLESMPAAYRSAFADEDVEEHAQIVCDRGAAPARAVVWRTIGQGLAILCVVTEDRPGLVAQVSSAFLAHALDVRAAQIYSRQQGAGVEAVDFFWLRNVTGASRAVSNVTWSMAPESSMVRNTMARRATALSMLIVGA